MAPLQDQTWVRVCEVLSPIICLEHTSASGGSRCSGAKEAGTGAPSKHPPSDTGGETESGAIRFAWLHSGQFLLYLAGHLDNSLILF